MSFAKPPRKTAAEKKIEAKAAKFKALVDASRAVIPSFTAHTDTSYLVPLVPCAQRKLDLMGYDAGMYHSPRFQTKTMGASLLYWAAKAHGFAINQRLWKKAFGVSQKAVWDAVPFLNQHGHQCDGLCGVAGATGAVCPPPAPPAAPTFAWTAPQLARPLSPVSDSGSDDSQEGYLSSGSSSGSPSPSPNFGLNWEFSSGFSSDNETLLGDLDISGSSFGSDGMPEPLELPASSVVAAPLSPNARKRKSPATLDQQEGKLEQTKQHRVESPFKPLFPPSSPFHEFVGSPPVGPLPPLPDLSDDFLPNFTGFYDYGLDSLPFEDQAFLGVPLYE